MKKKYSNLIRPIAKQLEPKNDSQFQLLDNPDSDNCIDNKLNWEKIYL